MNSRKQQAKQILQTPNIVIQTDTQTFTVKSMTTSNKYYTVSRTENGLLCSCADHQYRKDDCKHIHVILDINKQNRGYANNEFKIMKRVKLNLCKYCSLGNLKKDGYRVNKKVRFNDSNVMNVKNVLLQTLDLRKPMLINPSSQVQCRCILQVCQLEILQTTMR